MARVECRIEREMPFANRVTLFLTNRPGRHFLLR